MMPIGTMVLAVIMGLIPVAAHSETVLLVGDSNTQQAMLAPADRWSMQVAASRPDLTIVNDGFGGTVLDVARFALQVEFARPSVVVSWYAGTNDVPFGRRPSTTLHDLRRAARLAWKTGAIFVQLTAPPARDAAIDAETMRVAQRLAHWRQRGVLVLDARDQLMPWEDYTVDGLHLNASGSFRIAALVRGALDGLVPPPAFASWFDTWIVPPHG